MGVTFEDDALEHLMYWIKQDRKTAQKIHDIIKSIQRNGLAKGIGHPEPLKHRAGWSRHIDHGNRLVYDLDDQGNLHILACKGHYED